MRRVARRLRALHLEADAHVDFAGARGGGGRRARVPLVRRERDAHSERLVVGLAARRAAFHASAAAAPAPVGFRRVWRRRLALLGARAHEVHAHTHSPRRQRATTYVRRRLSRRHVQMRGRLLTLHRAYQLQHHPLRCAARAARKPACKILNTYLVFYNFVAMPAGGRAESACKPINFAQAAFQ